MFYESEQTRVRPSHHLTLVKRLPDLGVRWETASIPTPPDFVKTMNGKGPMISNQETFHHNPLQVGFNFFPSPHCPPPEGTSPHLKGPRRRSNLVRRPAYLPIEPRGGSRRAQPKLPSQVLTARNHQSRAPIPFAASRWGSKPRPRGRSAMTKPQSSPRRLPASPGLGSPAWDMGVVRFPWPSSL